MKKTKWMVPLLSSLLLFSACSNSDTDTASNNKSADGKTKVVIAVGSSNPFLEKATEKFESAHPDIDIEIKEYMAMPKTEGGMGQAASAADMEKFIQTVTTQIMAGKGSDLILTSDLPENKLAEKNLLVDYRGLMEKDNSFDKSKYFDNILKSSEIGGGLYAMPFSFVPDVITGKTDMLKKANVNVEDKTWTWDQFKEIAKKVKSQNGEDFVAFVNMFPVQLMAEYVEDNYSKLVEKGKANFDSDDFRIMMKQVKSMYDEGVLKAEFTYDYDKGLFSKFSMVNPTESLVNILKPGFEVYQKPTVKGGAQAGAYQTYFKLGMNSKSSVQKEAWEFVKFLLSDEIQSLPEMQGIPLNKNVVEKQLQKAEEAIKEGTLQVPHGKPDAKVVEARVQTMKSILEHAGLKRTSDFKVTSIILEEFQSYMSGQKTAEQVSKLIQNRVNTYLNE